MVVSLRSTIQGGKRTDPAPGRPRTSRGRECFRGGTGAKPGPRYRVHYAPFA